MADKRNRTPFYGAVPTSKIQADHVFMDDGTSVQDAISNIHNIVDNEIQIGTLNGVPLYQQRFNFTSPSTASAGVIATTPPIDTLYNMFGFLINSLPINFNYGSNFIQTFFDPNTNSVYMRTTGYNSQDGVITIQYTKPATRSRKKVKNDIITDMIEQEG